MSYEVTYRKDDDQPRAGARPTTDYTLTISGDSEDEVLQGHALATIYMEHLAAEKWAAVRRMLGLDKKEGSDDA